MVEKYQRDLSETQAALYEEEQSRNKLKMELDAKDSEIELLQQKLSIQNLDTASIHSGSLEDGDMSLSVHNSSISSTGLWLHVHCIYTSIFSVLKSNIYQIFCDKCPNLNLCSYH